jgi:Family of unknown function (DUF5906)
MSNEPFYKQVQKIKASHKNVLTVVDDKTAALLSKNKMQDFLKLVLPAESESGAYVATILMPPKNGRRTARNIRSNSISDITRALLNENSRGNDAYICLSKNCGKGRKGKDATVIKVLFVDIDCGENKSYLSQVDALSKLKDICDKDKFPRPSIVVNSGFGVHVYWVLKNSINTDEWKPYAEGIKQSLMKYGLKIDPSVTGDIAQILRPPETFNYKNGIKKPVTLLLDSGARYDFNVFSKYKIAIYKIDNSDLSAGITLTSPEQIKVNIDQWLRDKCLDTEWAKDKQWLRNVQTANIKESSEGSYINFNHCLFHEGHDVSHAPSVFIGENGKLGWSCRGQKCVNIHWHDVKDLLDSNYIHLEIKSLFTEEEALEYMNNRFFMGQWGNNYVTVEELSDKLIPIKDQEFRKKLANRQVKVGNTENDIKIRSIANWWEHNANRREYEKIVFDPSKTTGGSDDRKFYNLWRGYAVIPAKGDWTLLRSHINDVLCCSDKLLFECLLNWLALLVQQPCRPHGSAIIIKSEREGTGKGVFMSWLRVIFGMHALLINDKEHLVGGFNRHLENIVLVTADEPTYAGDHAANRKLKSLITENTILIEPKGFDSYQAENHMSLVIATNEDWVINAGLGARRFIVCEVDDRYAGDKSYFMPLCKQAANGGIQAMLYDLLQRDISQYDPQQVVRTKALTRQRMMSLSSLDAMLVQMYMDESATPLSAQSGISSYALGSEVPVHTLHEEYLLICKQRVDRHPMDRRVFSMKMSGYIGKKTKKVQKYNQRYAVYDFPTKSELGVIVTRILR